MLLLHFNCFYCLNLVCDLIIICVKCCHVVEVWLSGDALLLITVGAVHQPQLVLE